MLIKVLSHEVLYRRQFDLFQFLEDVYPLIQKTSLLLTGRELELESGVFFTVNTTVSSGGQKNLFKYESRFLPPTIQN